MPRARKTCSHYSCPNVQPCPDHQRKPWEGSKRNKRSKLSGSKQQKRRSYLLRRDKLTCAICGEVRLASGLEVDHKTPLAEGGADTLKNCQLACLDCHKTKTQAEAARGRQVGR